jgi:Protein of unknown function (DUF3024)
LALSEFEAARVRKAVGALIERRRPPPQLRAEVDFGFHISGHSVELFEVRPIWQGPPGEKLEHPFAKATFVRSKNHWRVFWMRQDLKWHGYDPAPQVATIEEFTALVQEDAHACFFG